jgi:hypothetical protein
LDQNRLSKTKGADRKARATVSTLYLYYINPHRGKPSKYPTLFLPPNQRVDPQTNPAGCLTRFSQNRKTRDFRGSAPKFCHPERSDSLRAQRELSRSRKPALFRRSPERSRGGSRRGPLHPAVSRAAAGEFSQRTYEVSLASPQLPSPLSFRRTSEARQEESASCPEITTGGTRPERGGGASKEVEAPDAPPSENRRRWGSLSRDSPRLFGHGCPSRKSRYNRTQPWNSSA